MKIHGTVAPGFESVKALFESNMTRYAERNAQLCIYHGDQMVVDLWASAVDDDAFGPDSLINVFSSGKSLESILLSMLVDRGLLAFEAPITDYWPEFAANGKADTTVADLMRHESGLAVFDTTIDPPQLHTACLKQNVIGAIIERQSPKFRPGDGNQRDYHAITRGWVANEVFRRVEPQGRTMGEFLREEISTPLDIDVYINLQEPELARINPVKMLGFGYQLLQSLIPRALGRRIVPSIGKILSLILRLLPQMRHSPLRGAPDPITGIADLEIFNSAVMAKGETPSAGSKCSARGLGKLAAVMANGGQLGDHTLLGAGAWQALHEAPIPRNMMAMNVAFTQGGVAALGQRGESTGPLDSALHEGREGFYGWMGLGGSLFQWHPELNIGFAFVPTSLHALDLVNERGKTLQAEVRRCVENLA